MKILRTILLFMLVFSLLAFTACAGNQNEVTDEGGEFDVNSISMLFLIRQEEPQSVSTAGAEMSSGINGWTM